MVRFSQNFLVNKSLLPKIIEAADLSSEDIVVEIGPGRGILTEQLCQKVQKVIAFEIDDSLIPDLEKLQQKYSNLKIINADFNQIDWRQYIKSKKYKIVANIPYHVTGLIFRNIFQHGLSLPQSVVLMIQYEVAKKIIAAPDNQTKLSNLINAYGQPKLICKVDKSAFRPIPKVDSAVLAVDNIKTPDADNFEDFFRLIKIGFSSRRKTILNNLSSGYKIPKDQIKNILTEAQIDPTRRAQTLAQTEWKKLYYILENLKKVSSSK
ncbi:MAG: 16S rRNA (adenine(1518)-N(6)/adenine(1519)-N(6))-dimethyltransferase RsmA [Patescibacteria group bacterium]